MIISNIYKRAFNVLSKMPFKLWGLSLLSSLLTILVLVFGVLPIVIVPGYSGSFRRYGGSLS